MIANLRSILASLSCLAVVSWASVAFGLEGVLSTPAEPQQRASNAGGSYPLTKDDGFLVASAEELVADDTAARDSVPSEAVATDAVMSKAAAPNLSCGCNGGCPCDSCCSCGCCCLPLWVVSAGAVILHRDRPSDGTIVAAFPGTTPSFSRGSDFGFGWNVGPSIAIARRIGSRNYLEVRYFNSYGSAGTQFVTPGNFIGAGFTGPGGTLITGSDLTKLDSTEINWRHQRWNRLALLAGFRWIELRDGVSYNIGNVAASQYNFFNHLYGAQIGADWALTSQSNPLQISVVGKAGIFGNANSGGIYEFSGHTPIGSFTGQGTGTAFVGDLSFSASYALTNHIAIRGGYQTLWLTNLALGADAASRSLLNPALLRTVNDNGSLFYQGATVGMDFTW